MTRTTGPGKKSTARDMTKGLLKSGAQPAAGRHRSATTTPAPASKLMPGAVAPRKRGRKALKTTPKM